MQVEWMNDEEPALDPAGDAEAPAIHLRRAWVLPMLIASVLCLAVTVALSVLGGYVLGRHSVGVPRTIHVDGRVVIADKYAWIGSDADAFCTAEDPFGDVVTTAPVLILDGRGLVLAGAQLSPGRAHPYGCEFTFSTSVVRTDASYLVKVANEEQVPFTAAAIGSPVITLR